MRKYCVWVAVLAVGVLATSAWAQVTINEIRIDQPGSDNDEYFELFGPEGTVLDGLTYLVIGDGTGGSGVIESVTDLTGSVIAVGSGGFFLAAESTFTIGPPPDLVTSLNFENSDNVTHMLVSGFTGADGDDLDLDDDCVLDVTPWTAVVDSVSLKESAPPDCMYSPTVVGPDGSFVPGHVFRCFDGVGGWQIGSFGTGTDDTPRAPNACAGLLTINEIRIDQPGSDNDEYFELAGPEGFALDGLTYLVIGDGTGGSGVIESVTDLTGSVIAVGSGGFFLAAESTFTIGPPPDLVTSLNFENSDNVTHMLVAGFTGANGDDLDLDDDCVLDITPWVAVVDSVSLKESAPPDCMYGDVIVGPDGSFVPGHVKRCPDLSGPWEIGLFDPAGGDDTPRAANACCITAITQQPQDQFVFEGGTAVFNVVATGQGTITYQWRKDGIDLVDGGNISGSQTDTLTVSSVTVADEGMYDVVVTSDCGPVTSNAAQLVVIQVPDVVINEIRTDESGSDVDEYFELSGVPGTSLDGLSYIVIGDGAGGSGVVEAVVDLTGLTIPADGYFLGVEDTFALPCGDVPDLVLSGAGNGLNFENSDNVTHMLVLGFTGANGDDLDLDDDCVLDTTPWVQVIDDVSLIIGPVPPENCFYSANVVGPDGNFAPAQVYRCPDTVGGWQIGSFSPTCHQNESPGFVNPPCVTAPASLTVCEVDPAVFTVTGDGVGTILFQWKKDGVDLADGGNISGSQTDTLTIDPTSPADAGSYTCVVTDDNGSVESDAAILTIDPRFDVRAGNVNGGVGPVTDVLFLNGGVGSDPERKVVLNSASDPFQLVIDAPPSRPQARYVVYLWNAVPDCATREVLPNATGEIALPTPLTGNAPQPVRIAKSFPNRPQLGDDNWFPAWSPVGLAPYTLIDVAPGGIHRTGLTFYVQGLIHDPLAPDGKTGVTNGILIEIQ